MGSVEAKERAGRSKVGDVVLADPGSAGRHGSDGKQNIKQLSKLVCITHAPPAIRPRPPIRQAHAKQPDVSQHSFSLSRLRQRNTRHFCSRAPDRKRLSHFRPLPPSSATLASRDVPCYSRLDYGSRVAR